MDQPPFDIEELLFKQLQGVLSAEETALLEVWKAEKPGNSEFASQLLDPARLTEKLRFYAAHQQEEARNEAIRLLFPQQHTIPLRRWWAAAAVLILLAAGGYLYHVEKGKPSQMAVKPAIIAPGRQGAILTLADGTKLLLDTVKNGVVALEGGVSAIIVNGSLHYKGTGADTIYNTISTPKGRLFQVTLPDGTQVWLNSASSIRYPISFNGAKRQVAITGEAYFEVTPNPRQPFVVAINNKAEVQVLGTHFNVNAYDNEHHIATTLLKGSVQVKRLDAGNVHASVTLRPGQQAEWKEETSSAGINVVAAADIDKVMAWKNGLFNFEGASLEEVMRQLERWYDIEVVFVKPIPDIRFGGKMTKGVTLNEMLEILKGFEGADLKFRMEGERKLVVSQ
jgi:ferric-dicitrate binding protein FerR (iron transport regulator)